METPQPPQSLRFAAITASDTRTVENDTSGTLIVEALTAAGHTCHMHCILQEDLEGFRTEISEILDEGIDVLVITGGTGITARDISPEALAPLITKELPGFGELFRWLSYAEIGAATIQSRAMAALCGKTIVFLLPGSPGAVRLALEKLIIPQLDSRTRPCNFAQLLPRC